MDLSGIMNIFVLDWILVLEPITMSSWSKPPVTGCYYSNNNRSDEPFRYSVGFVEFYIKCRTTYNILVEF